MRRSNVLLRVLSVGIAIALFLVVRGERRVTETYTVPLEAVLPARLRPVTELPTEVTVSVSGSWARLRTLDPDALGPIRLDLSRAGSGGATWYVRPEALHVPRGVHVDSIYPAQGTVELRRGVSVEAVPSHP